MEDTSGHFSFLHLIWFLFSILCFLTAVLWFFNIDIRDYNVVVKDFYQGTIDYFNPEPEPLPPAPEETLINECLVSFRVEAEAYSQEYGVPYRINAYEKFNELDKAIVFFNNWDDVGQGYTILKDRQMPIVIISFSVINKHLIFGCDELGFIYSQI